MLFIAVFTGSINVFAQQNIRLNQVGFYPSSEKIAVDVADTSGSFEVLDKNSSLVLKSKIAISTRPALSGKRTGILDFSVLKKPGTYTLKTASGQSYPFTISKDVYMNAGKAAIKAFYYQRASIELTSQYAGKWARKTGHPDNKVLIHSSAADAKRPEGTVVSASRGWYDAGDYNKYIVNSGITMGTLLSLYEDFPAYFKHLDLNIPESKNQLPDILDEVLWNLRWMLAMQDPNDGGVYHKLTNAKFDAMVMPDKSQAEPRYIVQKGTAATLDFAAVCAQAARILKNFDKELPGLSDSCLNASERAWLWAQSNRDVVYDQDKMNKTFQPPIVTGAYGDHSFSDEFNWAAAELYVTTKKQEYISAINLNADLSLPNWAQVNMLAVYSLLRAGAKVKPGVKEKFLQFASNLIKEADQTAYKTVMGQTARDFNWGSSSNAANQGIACINAFLISKDRKYLAYAQSNVDYLLGRNGTGYSYETGVGSKPVMHPHHRPSVADDIIEPIPGLLSGGPNPGMQDGVKVPSLIPDEAFIDDDRAYACNEIAINWNAPLVYLVNALQVLQKQIK
ncbi:cellulase [Pedobacter sp. HMF7647]|uniref:Endoglucanase n=1 Tax=Hufsiella arboris TaxID=2695275 RepID=A0A7K1Y568_9SPHI|nr:cellulase [Hufsiella arboris]